VRVVNGFSDITKNTRAMVLSKLMSSDEEKNIQKKINWISAQIRETKIQLNRQYKELKEDLKDQETLRNKKNQDTKIN